MAGKRNRQHEGIVTNPVGRVNRPCVGLMACAALLVCASSARADAQRRGAPPPHRETRPPAGAATDVSAVPAMLPAGEQQEFSRDVTTHTDTYTITTAGSVRPQGTFLRIENTGDTAVVRPKVVVNGSADWSTTDAILAAATAGAATDREKALMLWQFARENRYHWYPPSDQTQEDSDPVKLFTAYGYGFCTNVAAVLAALWERAGMPARFWTIGPNGEHQASEVFYDGGWHLLDADRDGLYLMRDNRTVAGVEDLIRDPSLVARAGAAHADLVPLYAGTPVGAWVAGGPDVYSTAHALAATLRPHESLELRWNNTGRYHDDTGADGGPPPTYANGTMVSSVDLADPGYRRWIASEDGVRSIVDDGQMPRLSASKVGHPGELVFRVDSSYPIVGANLVADIHRTSSADVVEVHAVGWGTGIDLFDATVYGAAKAYRVPGVFVSESNIRSYADDAVWPPLHAALGGQPATVVFGVQPSLESDQRVVVGGVFYRRTGVDVVGMSICTDGFTWTPVWTAQPDQTGYFMHFTDLTDSVATVPRFLLRYEFDALSGGSPSSNWTAGIQAIHIGGVAAPPDRLAWSAPRKGGVGDTTASIDLSTVVAPSTAAAVYHYTVRFVLAGAASPLDAGLNRFALTTTVQLAPRSLPSLALGVNQVSYSDESSGPAAVTVTHGWTEYDEWPATPSPPVAPIAPATGGVVSPDGPISLRWRPAGDPAKGGVLRYHVELCGDPLCRWPLSSIFDVDLPQGAGDADPSWVVPFTDWLDSSRTYYWRVKAESRATGRWSDYGPIWSFTLSSPRVRRALR